MNSTNTVKSLKTQFWFFFDGSALPDVWYAETQEAALTEMKDLGVQVVHPATDDDLTSLVGPFWHISLPKGYCRVPKTDEGTDWIQRVYPDQLSVRETTKKEALDTWKNMRLEQDLRDDEEDWWDV